jgi:hypothetical protein
LIVPRGHSAWWGVDPSTVRLSVAYVTREGARGVRTVPFARAEGPARLSEIYAQTASFAAKAARGWQPIRWQLTPQHPWEPVPEPAVATQIYAKYQATVRFQDPPPAPGLVLVEQPSGKMENPNLSYAVGVIQAALYDGLYSALGRAVRIETCTSGWWKKRATGRGDVNKTMRVPGKEKPVPVPHDEYGVLRWARQNGYAGCSWDEADAWGIAEAARREVALEER